MTYDKHHPFSPNYESRLVDTKADKAARPWHVARAMGQTEPRPVQASPSLQERSFKVKPTQDHPLRKKGRQEAEKASKGKKA